MVTKWIIIAGLLFVGEIITTGFILFWFGVSAVVCAVLAYLGVVELVQGITFVTLAALMIGFTRSLTKGLVRSKTIPSNVFAIIGKEATVVNEINNVLGQGQIKVSGEVWKAESENGEDIKIGTDVQIVKVEGVRAIVKTIKHKGD